MIQIAIKVLLILQLDFSLDSVSSGAIVVESGHGLVSATPYRPDPCDFNCYYNWRKDIIEDSIDFWQCERYLVIYPNPRDPSIPRKVEYTPLYICKPFHINRLYRLSIKAFPLQRIRPFSASLFHETIHQNPTDGIKRCPFSGFWKLMPNRHQLFVESDSIRLRRPTARPIGCRNPDPVFPVTISSYQKCHASVCR